MSWWNPYDSAGKTVTPTIIDIPTKKVYDGSGLLVNEIPGEKLAANSRGEVIGKLNESGSIKYVKSESSEPYITKSKLVEPEKVKYRDQSGNVVIGDDGQPIMVDDDTPLFDENGEPIQTFTTDPLDSYDPNYDYQSMMDDPNFNELPAGERDRIIEMNARQVKEKNLSGIDAIEKETKNALAAELAAKETKLTNAAISKNQIVRENLNDVVVRLQSSIREEEEVTFNVMPIIEESRQVNYAEVDLVHGIGGMLKWKNTGSRQWKISEIVLVSRTREEATKNLQRLLMLRYWTMPYFGYGTQKTSSDMMGAPPPILYFTAYSDLIANVIKGERIPVVLANYSWSFPTDCDWIPTLPADAISGHKGSPFFTSGLLSNAEGEMDDLTNIVDFYDPRSKTGFPITGGTPFPTIMKINIDIKESYSPKEISQFDLSSYRNAQLTESFGQTPRMIRGLKMTPSKDEEIIKLRKMWKAAQEGVANREEALTKAMDEIRNDVNNMSDEDAVNTNTGSQEQIDARNAGRDQKKKEATERVEKKDAEDAAKQRVTSGKGSTWENLTRDSSTGKSKWSW